MVIVYFNNLKVPSPKGEFGKGVTYKQAGDIKVVACSQCKMLIPPKMTYADIQDKSYCLSCHRPVIEGWDE